MEQATKNLIEAVCADDVRAVKKAIEAGADFNYQGESGKDRSILMVACREYRFNAALALIEAGADVNAEDGFGSTALMMPKSVMQDSGAKVLNALIVAGADVNHTNKEGYWTPLMNAAHCGSARAVLTLLRAGADVAYKQPDERTVASVANGEAIVPLMKHGMNVYEEDENNCTPLMRACMGGKPEIVENILDAGYDASHKNSKGHTALSAVIRPEYIDILKAHGLNVAKEALPALISAILTNTGEKEYPIGLAVANALLEYGVDVNALDGYGCSPFHYAVAQGKMVSRFIEKGADVNKPNRSGFTPLMLARNPEVISLLLQKGAKSPVKNQNRGRGRGGYGR